jgi:hypothetical protein
MDEDGFKVIMARIVTEPPPFVAKSSPDEFVERPYA